MLLRLLNQLARFAPLLLVVSYISLSYGLFLFGPIRWDAPNISYVTIFMSVCLIMLVLGYSVGMRSISISTRQIPWRPFFWVGAIASGVLLFPSAWIYMNKNPWDALHLAQCQNVAYMEMINGIGNDSTGYRYIYVLARAFLAPFTFSVLPLCILHWDEMRWKEYALLAVYLLSALCMSLLRGTDKEIADIVIMLLATLPIVTFRALISRDLPFSRLLGLLSTIAVVIFAGAYMFMERKDARLFRSIPAVAEFNKGHICSAGDWRCACDAESSLKDASSLAAKLQQETCTTDCVGSAGQPVPNSAPPDVGAADKADKATSDVAVSNQTVADQVLRTEAKHGNFLAVMATGYLSQGYLGLSIAMTEDFSSTFGIGHSPLLLHFSKRVLGDDFEKRAYTNKIADRWDAKAKWSTAMTWWANDVSFYGVPFIFAALGLLTAFCWREATEQHRDASAIVLVLCMFLFFYLPANNQLFMTADSGVTVLFWIVLLGWTVISHRTNDSARHVQK